QASGSTLTCPPTPTIIATGGPGEFLDKEFASIDQARGQLYISYTRFGAPMSPTEAGQIELARCDLSPPLAPMCNPGPNPMPAPNNIVSPGMNCEQEGAYPAVDEGTGDVYVAWEYNWGTNFDGTCPN